MFFFKVSSLSRSQDIPGRMCRVSFGEDSIKTVEKKASKIRLVVSVISDAIFSF